MQTPIDIITPGMFGYSSSSRPFGECLDSVVPRPAQKQGSADGQCPPGPHFIPGNKLHPESFAKQVSNAGSPALLLSDGASLCDHTPCCYKEKLQMWNQGKVGLSWPLLPVANFHPVLCSSNWEIGVGVGGSYWMMGGEEGLCLSSGMSFLALPHQ